LLEKLKSEEIRYKLPGSDTMVSTQKVLDIPSIKIRNREWKMKCLAEQLNEKSRNRILF